MEQILSKENAKIKKWTKLKQTKHIKETNLVLLEGQRLIFDAKARGTEFEAICTSQKELSDFACPVFYVPEHILKTLCDTQNPQNIVAIAKMPKKKFEMPQKNFLILDGVQDPGNFGTIIRTAVACDFQIYALNCVDFRNSKVLRSSMGTIFDADIFEIEQKDLEKFSNYKIYSATMEGENVFKFKDFPKQFGLVMGNEAHGLSNELLSLNFEKLCIPMKNNVESLNVAISCGILMCVMSNKN